MNPSHSPASSFDDKFIQEAKALDRALKENITIHIDPANKNRYLASSHSNPGDSYLVTIYPFTCTCTGYNRWFMCKHVALVRATLVSQHKAVKCPHCNVVFALPITSPETLDHLISNGVYLTSDEEPTL